MSARAARLCMVAATLLWGGTFVVIRDTLAHLDPLSLVFTRFVAAPCPLAPWPRWRLGPGEGLTLLGALAFGLQIIAVARCASRVDPVVLTGIQALTVALTLAPFGRRAVEQLGVLPAGAWWRLGYLVLAGSVLAPLLQVIAQRSLPPGRVGLLFQLES